MHGETLDRWDEKAHMLKENRKLKHGQEALMESIQAKQQHNEELRTQEDRVNTS